MSATALAQLVSRKHQVLTHLVRLGLRQVELVRTDEWTQLANLLSTKEQLLSLLMSIESELEPFRAEQPASRAWPSADARLACQREADECAAMLSDVMRLERESESEMTRRRDDAAHRLSGLHAADSARHAYAEDAATSSLGLDLVSES
jgi:hypothetical protein